MNRLISVERAERLIRAALPAPRVGFRPIREAAGCTLMETIRADRDLPPYDRVTMDGIALRHGNAGRIRIEGVVRAGAPRAALRDPDACVEIMTGAVLPRGCDAVVPYEDLRVADGRAVIRAPARKGQFIHRRGSDRRKGEVLLRSGDRLDAPRIALLAAVGRSRVRVRFPPSVAVISTGDEIVEVGRRVASHQIRPSNACGVAAALRARGCRVECPIVGDREDRIFQSLEKALSANDVVLVSGGVSKGRADFVPAALRRLGVRCVFHGVSQQPGRPLWFGTQGRKLVFALPGNPVSSLACFTRFVVPAFWPAPAEFALLARRIEYRKPLTFFQPVRVVAGRDGVLRADPVRYGGSGDLAAASAGDGFLELEKGVGVFPAGSAARFWRWPG